MNVSVAQATQRVCWMYSAYKGQEDEAKPSQSKIQNLKSKIRSVIQRYRKNSLTKNSHKSVNLKIIAFALEFFSFSQCYVSSTLHTKNRNYYGYTTIIRLIIQYMFHHQKPINNLLLAIKTITQISNIYQLTVLNDVVSDFNVFEPDSDRMTKHNLKTSTRF